MNAGCSLSNIFPFVLVSVSLFPTACDYAMGLEFYSTENNGSAPIMQFTRGLRGPENPAEVYLRNQEFPLDVFTEHIITLFKKNF